MSTATRCKVRHAYQMTGSGYVYILARRDRDWKNSKDARWDIDIYTATGLERYIGLRAIDGSYCRVFRCPDSRYRAQVTAACLPG